MATAIDSLLLAVTVLSQIGGTALLVQHSTWGQNLPEMRQWGIVAAITAAYASFLRFLLNWRSKRQVGDRISFPAKLFASFSSIGLSLVVLLAFKESYTIERLWACALFAVAACCVIDLTRAVRVSADIVVLYPVCQAIWNTKELLFWRIGFLIMSTVLLAVMVIREFQFADLREKEASAGVVKKAEHE